MQPVKTVRGTRTLGVSALARELKVSRSHVSHVLNGQHQSRRVEEAARLRGWVPPKRRHTH